VIFDKKGERIGGAFLLGVVTLKDSAAGRQYRVAADRDYEAVWNAQKAIAKIANQKLPNGLSPVPDEPLRRVPVSFGVINVWVYGIEDWGHLFSSRQAFLLSTLAERVRNLPNVALREGMAILIDRMADGNASLSNWLASREEVKHVFGRQALGMVWDFAEVNPFSDATRSLEGAIDLIAKVASEIASAIPQPGQVQLLDARESALPESSSSVWFTDPPYYDNVPYSYISDFFYVWLKRVLLDTFGSKSDDGLTPKAEEIVAYLQNDGDAQAARTRFEKSMGQAFDTGRKTSREDGIGAVVFAHKTTEGWEALLEGLIKSHWIITASWPVATEMGSRLRARNSAALATSIHLICRPEAKVPKLAIGGTCCANFRIVLATGWSGCHRKACAARTSSSLASARRWKFTAATPKSKTRRAARYRLAETQRPWNPTNAGSSPMFGKLSAALL
jgi:putative DNA methylase